MLSIFYALYLFVLATAIAWLEIQIEGPNGWAEKAPCWRPDPNSGIARGYAKLMGGKPLTGYHIAIVSLVIITLHFPFFAGVSWSLVKELEVFSAFLLVTICWDFLWFVWNPYYGLKKFSPQFIWWHKKWTGPVPTDYFIVPAVSLVFALIATALGGITVLIDWGVNLGVLVALTLVSCLIATLVKRKS